MNYEQKLVAMFIGYIIGFDLLLVIVMWYN